MNVASIRDELQEHGESLAEVLARANHLLAESFERQVKWHGLSATEWRVLAALSERDGVAMTELAEQVLFKQPTLTKAIDRMERAQLVQRRRPSEDRRRTLVHLSELGRRIATPLLQHARQHQALLDRALGDAASRDLKAALLTLIDRVRELPREQRPPRGSQAAGR
jgi:MarR family transcriptional regulator, organic hydroperoxide resistance regulator